MIENDTLLNREAEAYIMGELNPQTLVLERVYVVGNWHGFGGQFPSNVITRMMDIPVIVIQHAKASTLEDCFSALEAWWKNTKGPEGAIKRAFPWESFNR